MSIYQVPNLRERGKRRVQKPGKHPILDSFFSTLLFIVYFSSEGEPRNANPKKAKKAATEEEPIPGPR
jgi:hypothetical protein